MIYKSQTPGANANYVQLVGYSPLNFKDALRFLHPNCCARATD